MPEQHQERTRALARLAGGLAHDFNNILGIIKGYAHLMEKPTTSLEEKQNYISKIKAATERGNKLTQKMMTFSNHQIETNAVIDIVDLIKKNKYYLMSQLPKKTKLAVHSHVRSAPVKTYDDAILQIIQELLKNSAESMPEGGTIELTIDIQNNSSNNNSTIITLSDTGSGIDPEIRPHIFDPFFTTRYDENKSGLGLSIVYGLIQKLGGDIEINSTPNTGTECKIILPQAENIDLRLTKPPQTEQPTAPLQGYTALIVDDEKDLVKIVTSMLEEMNIHVISAYNGDEALWVQDEFGEKIDFLLTDIAMPHMNGIKLANLMQSLHKEISVIFMSGYPNQGEILGETIPENVTFMPKPIDYESLSIILQQKASKYDSNIDLSHIDQWKRKENG